MAAAAVDAGYLAASYSIPESTIQSLLSEPTTELVQALLTQIENRAREFEDLQSEKLKADVELDNAVQAGEQRARTLKVAAEKAQKETAELRQKLAQEEAARKQIEAQLHELQTNTSTSSTQIDVLESRIKTLESQNRDALATYETKATAYDRLAQELSEQHQKYVDLRKATSALEEKNQALESAANNVKFRETNLQQEIELLRKNNDWYEAELKTRSNDNTKFRKEKNAQIAELQRANADATETIDSLQRTEAVLRKHVEELKAKADEDRARIQQLEDDAASNEANFRSELDNIRRLSALHQKTAERTKDRLEEVQGELSTVLETAATEVGQLQAEIEVERNRAAEAEASVANMETLVENLEREANQFKHSVHMPGTPRRPTNGAYGTPGRAGSPAVFSPGGSQLKGGMTNTKILAENSTLKEQLRDARDESEQKSTMMQNMIDELEQLAPAIEELRRTNETLTSQISEMSTDLEGALAEKEVARKDERKARGDLEGVHRESLQLRQHVQDLTVQLRSLMWRQQASEHGLEALTAEQQQFIISSEDNQLPEGQSYGDTATDLLISQHLVLYKNIADIQSQNANLLRTIREVAQQHEGEEALSRKEQQEKDQQELSRLRLRVAEYEDQLKSLNTRAHSYKKERDMYRQVATSRGNMPHDSDAASAFAQSFNSQAPMTPLRGAGASQFNEQTPQANHIPGVDKLVKDLQNQVDILKEESATDRVTLKSQVDSLTKDNTQLQSEKIRLDSQVRREQDHYARLESSIKLLESEKNTLQERYHSIQTTLAKQDDKVVRAEQEAVDAVARAEGLDHELINLKASQSVWKTIEARLTERNQELMDERDRLSKMVTDIQSLRNEQELSNAENRRRLQDRVDALEAELQIAQRKLDDEVTEHKKASMQREYERTESQKRVDDLMKARNEAEIRCASADAARQQLEQRVDELRSQLQSSEERAQALQPVATSRASGGEDDEDSTTREEELASQILDLQRKLDRKQEDLEAANAQIEGFQNIAQEAEEALQAAIETRDDLQAELTHVQQEKDTAIADLQRRVDEISSEFTTTNTELTELRGQHEQDTMRLSQEKESLEAEIVNLKNDVSDYKAEAERQMQYVKSQAEIATRARQDYEHELAKHGDTMNTLRTLREEYNVIKSEITQFKSQAEAARAALEQSEENWKSTRSQYESQTAEAKRTYDDLKQHNKTLLQQFDDYKAQINDLKSNRAAATTSDGISAGASSSRLDEITTFLKQEKDILEAQLSVKDSEAKRLTTELAHVQNQLDLSREKLHAEQSRSRGSLGGTNLQTLQNQIEQLNVFRESNTTLRNDAARLEAKLADKNKEFESLHKELEPLRVRVEELEGELELTAGYLEQEKQQRDYWEKRFEKFVNKSEHIDPKDLEDLKKSNEDLQNERDLFAEQITGLSEEITTLKQQVQSDGTTQEAAIAEAVREARKKQHDSFQTQHREKMAAKNSVIDAITVERDAAQGQLTTVQQELDDARQQLTSIQPLASQSQEQVVALQQEVQQLQSQLTASQQELESAHAARDEALSRANASTQITADVNMGEEGQIDEGETQGSADQIASLQKSLDEVKKQLADAQNRAFRAENDYSALKVKESFMRDQVVKLEKDDAEKSNRIVELQGQLTTAQQQPSQPISDAPVATSPKDHAMSAEIEQLKQELLEARKALEDAKTAAAAAAAAVTDQIAGDSKPDSQAGETSTTLAVEVDQREAHLKELEQNLVQREAEVARREASSDKLKEKANRMLRERQEKHQEELSKLKAEHQVELERAQQPPTAASSQPVADPAADSSSSSITVEGLPNETATDQEVRHFINKNETAKAILRHNIAKVNKNVSDQLNAVKEDNAKLKAETEVVKAEVERLKKQESSNTSIKSETTQQQGANQDAEAALAQVKAESAAAIAKEKEMCAQKIKVKDSMAAGTKAKWTAIVAIAKATPTEEVKKAVEEASKAKPPPAATPAQQPSQVQAAPQTQTPTASVATQLSAQQQQLPIPANNVPNANGMPVPPQAAQSAPYQQPNASTQGGAAPNHLMAGQQGRGIAQPGFTGQVQPQFQQPAQQQQQGGRGRGDGMGTGPGALKSIMGNQSNLPRGGGSNIPLPGGRGRGQQQPQQQQQNPNQPPNINTQGHGASQIGRGGNRGGRGGGRGGAQPNQSSPRGSLNPGVTPFQPQVGMGRGQKRGADDEGDGAATRGKRPRGRGGQGGGGAPQGGE